MMRNLAREPSRGFARAEAAEQLKDWVRERFVLSESETVVVTDVAARLPGSPPLETVVTFWTTDGTRHHFKVFKAIADVVPDDLPPSWLKASLALGDGVECECC